MSTDPREVMDRADMTWLQVIIVAVTIGLNALDGFEVWSKPSFFNEFLVKCPLPAQEINDRLLEHNLLAGYAVGKDYPGMENYLLVAVTEMNTKEDIDWLVAGLQEVSNA